jgi:Txe/YoeB family toxin of toxin-antitoxin system
VVEEYDILYSKFALKDAKNLTSAKLDKKVKELIKIISINPFQNPPPYEKPVGNLDGLYSRRINIQYIIVYEVMENKINCHSCVSSQSTIYGKSRICIKTLF